jgi:pimeloyl-ACP methyl ester carboxylesterase
MPYQTISDNQQIHYVAFPGAEHEPVLLYIHGSGGDSANWPDQLQPLSPYSSYILDLPGHGRSPLPGCQTITAYTDVVVSFIHNLLPNQPIVLIGHSMGGAIAQDIALRTLPQIVAMVLIGTSAKLGVSPVILDNVLHNPQIAIDFVAQYAWSSSAPKQLIKQNQKAQAALSNEVFYGDFLACSTFDLRGKLHTIEIPALVISGTEDKMVPEKYGRLLAAELPNAQFFSVDGSGHYVMLENPDTVAAQVQDFLQTL